MNEWALLSAGRIVKVVTTNKSLTEVAKIYPGYEVANLYALPDSVQSAYQYWNERP